AAGRRSGEADDGQPSLLRARCRGELRLRDDRFEDARAAGTEEDTSRSLDEADGDDLPERELVDEDRDDKAGDSDGADDVGRDHHPLSIDAVADDAGDEAEQHDRQKLRERHYACVRRRVRHGEREQGVGDRRRARPDGREQLVRLEQEKDPVAPEGSERLGYGGLGNSRFSAPRCGAHSSRSTLAKRRYERSASRIASTNPSTRRGANPFSHQRSSTRTRASARSIFGSMRPTKRSRKTIGSTYQPHRRLAGGKKSSQTYSKPKRLARSLRSQTIGSNGGTKATEGGGSGG